MATATDEEDDALLKRTAAVVRGLGQYLMRGLRIPAEHGLVDLLESADLDLAWARRQILIHWNAHAFIEPCDVKSLPLGEFIDTCAQLEEIEGRIRSGQLQGMKEPALSFEALRLELEWMKRLAVFPKAHKNGDEGIWHEDERELRRLTLNLRRWAGQLMSMSERFGDFEGRPWWPTLLAHLNQRKEDLWELLGQLFHSLSLAAEAYAKLCNPGVNFEKMQRWRSQRTAFEAWKKRVPCSCWLGLFGLDWRSPRELEIWRRDIKPVVAAAEERLELLQASVRALDRRRPR